MKRKPAKRKPKLELPRTVSVAYLNLPDWRERLARVLHIIAPDLVGDPRREETQEDRTETPKR